MHTRIIAHDFSDTPSFVLMFSPYNPEFVMTSFSALGSSDGCEREDDKVWSSWLGEAEGVYPRVDVWRACRLLGVVNVDLFYHLQVTMSGSKGEHGSSKPSVTHLLERDLLVTCPITTTPLPQVSRGIIIPETSRLALSITRKHSLPHHPATSPAHKTTRNQPILWRKVSLPSKEHKKIPRAATRD